MLSAGRTQHPMLCAPVHSETLVRVTTPQLSGVRLPAPATMPATVHGDHCTSSSYAPAESTEDRPLVVLDGTWSQLKQLSRRYSTPLHHLSSCAHRCLRQVQQGRCHVETCSWWLLQLRFRRTGRLVCDGLSLYRPSPHVVTFVLPTHVDMVHRR